MWKSWVHPKLLEFERKKVLSKGKREKEEKGRKKEEDGKGVGKKRGREKREEGKERRKKNPTSTKDVCVWESWDAPGAPVTALLHVVVLVVSKAVFQQKREHFYQLREEKPEVK